MDKFDQTYLHLLEQADTATNIPTSLNELLNTLQDIQEEYFLSYYAAQTFDPTGVLSYPAFRQAMATYQSDPNSRWNQGMVFMTFLASLPGLGIGARLLKDLMFGSVKLVLGVMRHFVGVFAGSRGLRENVLPKLIQKGLSKPETSELIQKGLSKPETSDSFEDFYKILNKLGIKVDKDDVVKAARAEGIRPDAAYLGKLSKDGSWIARTLKSMPVTAAKATAGLVKRGSRSATAYNSMTAAALSANKYDKESLIDHMKNLPRGRTKQASYGGPALMGGRPGGTYVAPTRQ